MFLKTEMVDSSVLWRWFYGWYQSQKHKNMFLWIKTPCSRSKLWKLDVRYLGIDVLAKSRFHAMPWRIDSWIHVFVDGNGWFFNVFVNKNPLLEIHILKTIMVIMFLLHHCFMPWDPWNHVFEIHLCNVHSQYYDRRWFGEPKHGGRCFDGQIHVSFMEEVFLM